MPTFAYIEDLKASAKLQEEILDHVSLLDYGHVKQLLKSLIDISGDLALQEYHGADKYDEEAQMEADACREHFPEELQDNLEEHLRNEKERR